MRCVAASWRLTARLLGETYREGVAAAALQQYRSGAFASLTIIKRR